MTEEELNNAGSANGDPTQDVSVEAASIDQQYAGGGNTESATEGGQVAQSRPDTALAVQRPDGEFNVVKSKDFEDFGNPEPGKSDQKIDMLFDVTLPISIELGRTSMPIQDILNLGPGSVVELNRLAGEPVDLLVNDKLIAKGEVVVVDENFGIRVTTMVSQKERLKSLA